MQNHKKLFAAMLLAGVASSAFAQLNQETQCPPTATTCTGSNQNSGDTSTAINNGDTHSSSSQLGNSSASNASGNNINPEFDNRSQVTQNVDNATTGTISGGNVTGGNTNSSATGGQSNANGNTSTNNNTTGPSSASAGSNSGGNTLGSSSGGNTLNNGSSSGGNTMIGGATKADGGDAAVNGSGNSDNKNTNNTSSGAKNETAVGVGVDSKNTNANNVASGSSSGVAGSGNSAQGQSSDNKNTNKTGDQKTSVQTKNDSAVVGAGNSSVSVGGSSYSSNDKTIFIPPVVPPTPPSQLAVGNIVKETMACGPLVRVVKTPIKGTTIGFFVDGSTEQGFTYDLAEYVDKNGVQLDYREVPLPDGSGYRVFGHQAVVMAAIIGTSNAKNIAIGGGSSGGGWGQGGGGNSGAIQQLVTNIQVKPCDLGTYKYVEKPKAKPAIEIEYIEVPVVDKLRQ